MIVLWIILGIFVFLFLLLIVPLRLEFAYNEEPTVVLRYMFFKYQLVPEKQAKPSRKKPAAKPEEEKEAEQTTLLQKLKILLKRKGAAGFLQLVKELIVLLGGAVKRVLRRTRIQQLDICFIAGADNAADAAIQYGEACAVLYPAVSALGAVSPIRKLGVTVDLDYQIENSAVTAYGKLSILPLFAVKEGLFLLFRGIGLLKELKA